GVLLRSGRRADIQGIVEYSTYPSAVLGRRRWKRMPKVAYGIPGNDAGIRSANDNELALERDGRSDRGHFCLRKIGDSGIAPCVRRRIVSERRRRWNRGDIVGRPAYAKYI